MTRAFHEIPPVGSAAALAGQVAGAVPVLHTEHLTLRGPEIADFDTYADVLGSPRGRFILDGTPGRAEIWADFCSMVAIWMLRGHGLWTVVGDDGTVLGFVLIGAEPGDECHELGFIFSKDAEGKGLAFEAASAARDWAWSVLEVPRLVSYVAPGNARSAALALRLGATRGPDYDASTHVYDYPRPEAHP